jgi:hypothetical protein
MKAGNNRFAKELQKFSFPRSRTHSPHTRSLSLSLSLSLCHSPKASVQRRFAHKEEAPIYIASE